MPLCHNWQLGVHKLQQKHYYGNMSGEEHGLIITWKIILSFILVAQLSVTVQHRHRTVKPGCWDLHWFRGNKFENLTINRLVKGDCRINSVKNRNITSPPGSCTIHEISFLKIFSYFFSEQNLKAKFSLPPLSDTVWIPKQWFLMGS